MNKRNQYTLKMAEEVGEALETGELTYKQIAADMSKKYKMKINTSGVAYLRKMYFDLLAQKASKAEEQDRKYWFGTQPNVETKEALKTAVNEAVQDRSREWRSCIELILGMKHLDSKRKTELVLRFMELTHGNA